MGEEWEKIVLLRLMDNQRNPSHNQFWLLLSKKLSKEATPDELEELQSILHVNPELHHQADMLSEMWKQRAMNGNSLSEAAYMKHVMKFKDAFFAEGTEASDAGSQTNEEIIYPVKKRRYALFIGAFLIIAAGTLYFFTQKTNSVAVAGQAISSVATKYGNRTKIVLPDGTQVWLNAGSNLDYNNSTFNKTLREVSLNGEAYFDVTKDDTKPFVIHTKKMDIKVVGTAFNVRSYNDEKTAEASLIRGTIEVMLKDRKNQKIVLKPNEKISIATEEEKQIVTKKGEAVLAKQNSTPIPQIVVKELKPNPTYNIIPEIAWTQNKLSIEDRNLEDIGPMLEKWFGKTVIIQSESLKKNRYTGTFEKETIEQILSYFKMSYPFNFKIENDTIVIY